MRHYPDGAAIAHAVGYVGALNSADLKRLDAARYAGTSQTGKTGVESSFESALHGAAGYRHLVTNARGRQVPSDSSELLDSLPIDESARPGSNVYLSIDRDLQMLATRSLDGRRGAVVAIDPNSGEILALVSAPSFDPNLFAVGMSTAQYGELQHDPDLPLFNRAVRGRYPPGSTIKPMLALAALETGATNLTRKTFCRGYFMLPDSTHRYRDWKPEGHGPVDLHEAIAQSCDVYFLRDQPGIRHRSTCMTILIVSASATGPAWTFPARRRDSCHRASGNADRSGIATTSAGTTAKP